MADITVEIKGLAEVLAKLDKSLYSGPLRTFWQRAAIAVQGRAREKAPVDTGRLRASIMYDVDGASPPLYASVGSDVFYAPFQEFGTRFMEGRHYLQGGADESMSDIQSYVEAMGGEIAQAWGGG